MRRVERDPNPPHRQTPLIEDDSRMGRFVGKVKGLAAKGKGAVSSKYQSSKKVFGRKKKQDDVVELLAAGSSSSDSSAQRPVTSITTRPASNGATGSSLGGGSSKPYRGSASREPPKDIFDDI